MIVMELWVGFAKQGLRGGGSCVVFHQRTFGMSQNPQKPVVINLMRMIRARLHERGGTPISRFHSYSVTIMKLHNTSPHIHREQKLGRKRKHPHAERFPYIHFFDVNQEKKSALEIKE